MARVLITGGAGFIGSYIVDKFVAQHHEVFVIDDLSGGYQRNLNPQATFFKLDLRHTAKAAQIIEKIKPEIVYHLAANAAENKAQFSPIDITTRNYNAFINTLVPAIRSGVRRFVVTSSIAVYGAIQTPFKETDTPQPEDLYGLSKLMMEKSLHILSQVHNFEYVITRPHNVYGPRQNTADPYRNVVAIFMNSLLAGKLYTIYGNGEQQRCFSYVDDVVDALVKCATSNVQGMTFNVGSDHHYSINHLSALIQEISGIRLPPQYIATRPLEVAVAVADHTQAKKYLTYDDRTSLETGLRKTWEAIKLQGYTKPKYTEIELMSPLLPQNWASASKTKRKS